MTQPPATEEYPPVHWNDEAILVAAGRTHDALSSLLARNSQPTPTYWATAQWWSRRSIPDVWRPRLVFALLREKLIAPGKLFRLGDGRRGPGGGPTK